MSAACGSKDDAPSDDRAPPPTDDPAEPDEPADEPPADDDPWAAGGAREAACEHLDFADEVPIAEASGATWIEATEETPAHILVVGDSGTRGAFVTIDAGSGEVLARGRVPLDGGASDDLEGLTRRGEVYYAVTSSGWVRHYRRDGDGYAQTADAYALGPTGGERPAACANPRRVNCGRNYEGLCLAPAPDPGGGCDGVAVSKADGRAYCVRVAGGGRLAADTAASVAVGGREGPTGCHVDADDVLWVGSNAFDGNALYRITGWRDLGAADGEPQVERLGSVGHGFQEALAVAPGAIVYRFSDTGGAPSGVSKHRCAAP